MLMAATATMLTGVLGAGAYFTKSKTDKQTNCPLGTPAPQEIIAVVDRTDPFTPVQSNLLTTALNRIASDLRPGNRFMIVAFDGQATAINLTLFDRCHPGNAQTANELTETPAIIQRRYEKRFLTPLATAITQATTSSNARTTHLVPYLANLAAHTALAKRALNTRIVVFSDMAENNARYTVYVKGRVRLSAKRFAAYYTDITRGRLQNVSLDVRQLPHPQHRTRDQNRIKAAWKHALKDSNVTLTWGAF